MQKLDAAAKRDSRLTGRKGCVAFGINISTDSAKAGNAGFAKPRPMLFVRSLDKTFCKELQRVALSVNTTPFGKSCSAEVERSLAPGVSVATAPLAVQLADSVLPFGCGDGEMPLFGTSNLGISRHCLADTVTSVQAESWKVPMLSVHFAGISAKWNRGESPLRVLLHAVARHARLGLAWFPLRVGAPTQFTAAS